MKFAASMLQSKQNADQVMNAKGILCSSSNIMLYYFYYQQGTYSSFIIHNKAEIRSTFNNKCCPTKTAASSTISSVQIWPTPSCKNTFFTPSLPTSNPSIKDSQTLHGTKGSSFPDKTRIFFPRNGLEELSELKSFEAGSDVFMRFIREFGMWGGWNGIELVCARPLMSSR